MKKSVQFALPALLLLLMSACTDSKPKAIDGNELVSAVAALQDGQTIVVAKGTYDYYLEEGAKPGQVLFPIQGKKDVTIDGSGSELIIHGPASVCNIIDSKGVTLKNFVIKSALPSTICMKVTEKDDQGFTVEVVGDSCPFDIEEDGNIVFHLEGKDVRSRDRRISVHSLSRLAIQYLITKETVGDKDEFPASFSGIRWSYPADKTFRFDYYGDTHAKSGPIVFEVGETFALNLEEQRYRMSIYMGRSEDVTIENVRITRMGGMGLAAVRCGNVTLDGYSVWPEVPGTVSTTADMMFMACCYGNVTIKNCKVGYSLDDALNIHGLYRELQAIDGEWLTLPAVDFIRVGDQIEIVHPHTRAIYASADVEEIVTDEQDKNLYHVRVSNLTTTGEGDISKGLLVEDITLHPKVLIENNHFECYPHIRLSGRGGITVRHNTMKNACCAVLAQDLAPYWLESGRIANLTIEDNEFIDCNNMGGSSFISVGVAGWQGDETPKIHDTVIIRRNKTEGIVKDFVSIAGVKNCTVEE